MADTAAHDAFEALAPRLEPTMLIVTARTGDERSGCLVGFHAQCSISPLRYLVLLSTANHTWGVARHTSHLVVHFCDERDLELAWLFGGATGDQIDKFAECDWEDGPAGAPVLTQCRTWLEGRVLEQHPLGDHVAFVLEWTAGRADRGFRPLRLPSVDDVTAGHPA